MEKPSCGIIQDLLPSYRDNLTGESVTEMIGEHLGECVLCRQRYEELLRQQEQADREELSRGNRFLEKLKSIRYYVLGFFIGITVPVFAIVLWFLWGVLKNHIMFYWLL